MIRAQRAPLPGGAGTGALLVPLAVAVALTAVVLGTAQPYLHSLSGDVDAPYPDTPAAAPGWHAFAQSVQAVLDLRPAGHISDGDPGAPELDGATDIATFETGGHVYAAVASFDDDGVQILNVTDPANVSGVGSITDGDPGTPELDTASGIATFEAGGHVYAAVASDADDGVQILNLTDPANIAGVGSVNDGDPGVPELDGARGIATFETGGRVYAAVAASGDDAVQILDLTDPANVSGAGSITDGDPGAPALNGASDIDTFETGGHVYAAVASDYDDAVQILNLTDPANIAGTDSIADGDPGGPSIGGALGIATFETGGHVYAAVASFDDDAVQILNVTDPANISVAGSIADGDPGAPALNGAFGIATFEIGERHVYAAVASIYDDAVQILNLTDPANITGAGHVADGDPGAHELDGASDVTTFETGGRTYAAVTSSRDNGVQIVQLAAARAPPAVDAGPDQAVREGTEVALNGTASGPDPGDSISYLWSHDRPDLNVTLADPAALSTTFTAPQVDTSTNTSTTITFTLTATDRHNATASDAATVTVLDTPPNRPPAADAGPDQTVREGSEVSLNGTATDPDGDSVSYMWNQTSGPPVELLGADTPSPSFTAPEVSSDAVLAFEMAAGDGLDSTTDTVRVTVRDAPDASHFVTTWKTKTAGESITIPAGGTGGAYTVDWGDGTVDEGVSGSRTHSYDGAGTHTVSISGDFSRISLGGSPANAKKLQSIEQWGDVQWKSMRSAFAGASNMAYRATDAPDLSRVADTSQMFAYASSFDGDISGWDVSRVTDMTAMFQDASSFDGDLSSWNVSRVTDMGYMFYGASSFDGDISGWDVSRVTDMDYMFTDATSFDGDISGWDVSRVTRMSYMFYGATSFDQNLGAWYITLDSTAIGHGDIPGTVGGIAAQNAPLSRQNPAYGIGSGGDSSLFEINGTGLVLTAAPDRPADPPYTVNVTATGSFGSNNNHRVIEVSIASLPLTAGAGPDQAVTEGRPVHLNGTAVYGGPADRPAYLWTHDRPDLNVTLADPAALSTTFTAPQVDSNTTITFTLTATGRHNATATDAATVTVMDTPPNRPPTADAGPDRSVEEGAAVTLAGGATDPDGDSVSYLWNQTSGPPVVELRGADTPSPSFTAPEVASDAVLAFEMTAGDGMHNSTDAVRVTVRDVPESSHFVTTWKTKTAGGSITIPAGGTYTVDWGDGTVDRRVSGSRTHAYDEAGTHTVRIWGGLSSINLGGNPANAQKLQSIEQWGDIRWRSMGSAFQGASNMVYRATDAPDLSRVTDTSFMFRDAASFSGNLSSWDVSSVTNMDAMFYHAHSFNSDLSSWNVSRVYDMNAMFSQAYPFNSDLSAWDVSNVLYMGTMFSRTSFDGDISGWNVSRVIDMHWMFEGASSFNSDLSGWDVSSAYDMSKMFYGASSFNSDLSAWNVSRVDSMYRMFEGASSFNSDLSAWNVSRVFDMTGMFSGASSFNSDISGWNVSRVADMPQMFARASSFNSDLSSWDVSQMDDTSKMFAGASSFDGDLSSWNVSRVTDMSQMFARASSFDGDISGWDVSQVTDMHRMFAGASSFDGDLSSWNVSQVTDMSQMFEGADAFDQNLGNWYIVLDGLQASGADDGGIVGEISAQNAFLAGQEPAYGMGTGGDSNLFEIVNGTILKLRTPPDDAPAEGPYAVTVTSTGRFGTDNSRTFEIAPAENPRSPPAVGAGPDQAVREGTEVALNGTASDPDPGDSLAYLWTHDRPGLNVTLADPAALSTTFTAPQVDSNTNTTITFTLTATDRHGMAASDTVAVTILDVPADDDPPLQSNTAVLEAQRSFRDIGSITLVSSTPGTIQASWVAPAEPPANYRITWAKAGEVFPSWTDQMGNAFPTEPSWTITGLEGGERYKVKVRASYSGTAGDWSGELAITVVGATPANRPPAVDAGPDQAAPEGSEVALSGTATDPDPGDSLAYLWTHDQPTLNVTLADPAALSTTFTAPQVDSNTTITLTLTATDRHGMAASDTVAVTILDVPADDDDPPPAPVDPPEDTTTTTVLDPPDPRGPRDIGRITLASPAPGTIQAGWEPPAEGPAGYRISWAKAGEPFLTWSDQTGNAFPTEPSRTIAGLEEDEEYKVRVLARYDGAPSGGWSGELYITVAGSAPPNRPPAVDAGPDRAVREGHAATLTGTATDPDPGDGLAYLWTHDQPTLNVTLADPAAPATTFTAPQVDSNTTITFTLTATDRHNATASDAVAVTILDVPAAADDPVTATLTVVAHVQDDVDGFLELVGVHGVTTFRIGASTYAIFAAALDDGVQLADVTDPANPVAIAHVRDSDTRMLDGARDIGIFGIDGRTYAIVLASDGNGVQIIDVSDPHNPVVAGSMEDTVQTRLLGPLDVSIFVLDGDTYAAISASVDRAVQIVNVTDPLNPVPAGHLIDSSRLELATAFGIDTFEIGGGVYAVVVGHGDDGVQIVNVTDPHAPTAAGRVTDSHALELHKATDVSVFEVGGSVYAVVAGYEDYGVQVIDVTDPYSPVPTGRITRIDNQTGYSAVAQVDTFTAGGGVYAVFSSYDADRVHLVDLSDPYNPTDLVNVQILEIGGMYGADVFETGGELYAIVTGRLSHDAYIWQIGLSVDRAPWLAVNPPASASVPAGSAYVDAGAVCADDTDGDLTDQIRAVSTVNTAVPGGYTVTYACADSAGNVAAAARTVTVTDAAPLAPPVGAPAVVVVGDDPAEVAVGDDYSDAGATCSDDADGDLTGAIRTASDVNVNARGNYTVTYACSDSDGNVAAAARTVSVTDTDAPRISPVGHSTVRIYVGDAYADAGATCTDRVDGDLSDDVAATDNIDASAAGRYTVTYSCADSAGNGAATTRTVVVLDPVPIIADGVGNYTTLDGANGVDVFERGGSTYAVIAARYDSGVQVVDVTDPNRPAAAGSIRDDAALELLGARDVEVFERDGGTYAVVTGRSDDGVQVIDVTDPNRPAAAGSIRDSAALELDGATDVAVFERGNSTYAVVAAYDDDGVQVIDVTDPNRPAAAGSIRDSAALELDGAADVAVFERGNSTYAVVAAYDDNIVQVVDVTDPANPAAVGSISDNSRRHLEGPTDVAVFERGNSTYAVVTAVLDDGIQVIDVTDPANPAAVGRKGYGASNLEGLYGITTFEDGDRTHAIIMQSFRDGVRIVDLTDPSRPANQKVIYDNEILRLDGAYDAATFQAGGSTYAIVTASGDNGAQIIPVAVSAAARVPPAITLSGTSPVMIFAGSAYVDAGAACADDIDGDLTDLMQAFSTVNAAVPGNYTVTYECTDSVGQTATAVREVVVADARPPAFLSAVYEVGSGTVTITFDEPLNSTAHPDRLHVRDAGQSSGGATLGGGATWSVSGPALAVTLTAPQAAAIGGLAAPQLDIDQGAVFDLAGVGVDATPDRPITIQRDNRPPAADAGPDQAAPEGSEVSLNGTATDPDPGDRLAHLWTHDRPAMNVTLADPAAPSTTFTAPQVDSNTTITFTLTATDQRNMTASDTVAVTILDVPADGPPPAPVDIPENTTTTTTVLDPPDPRGPRDIGSITLASPAPGAIQASWEPPTEDPADYRISWAKAGDSYLTWTDLTGNAFPTDPSLTITGLEEDGEYKVKIRARYGGTSGDWSGELSITVAGSAPADRPPVPVDPPENTTTTTVLDPPDPRGPRDIGRITLASSAPGAIQASWEPPAEDPADYRITWAKAGDSYLTWTDLTGNAFPTDPSWTIAGLEEDGEYKVKIRARYGGTSGDWSGEATIRVAGTG